MQNNLSDGYRVTDKGQTFEEARQCTMWDSEVAQIEISRRCD